MVNSSSSKLTAVAALARDPSAISLASASAMGAAGAEPGPSGRDQAAGPEQVATLPFGQKYPLFAGFLASGASVAPAAAMTNPFGRAGRLSHHWKP